MTENENINWISRTYNAMPTKVDHVTMKVVIEDFQGFNRCKYVNNLFGFNVSQDNAKAMVEASNYIVS